MAGKEEKLIEQKTLLNRQKIKIRKQIIKLERLIQNADPESPLFTKYSEEKEALVVQLYSKETVYEQVINTLQTDVKKVKKDIRELIRERKKTGFFDPGDSRLKKDIQRAWNKAKDAVNIKKKYRNFKEKLHDDIYDKVESFLDGWEEIKDSYKYRFLHASVKGVIKLGLAPLKMATQALLTKKVDQKKFLGISYGGRRVGRYKFNDNLMRKYSSDYKSLSDNFYLLGNNLYNREIKKGRVDAGDIITYLKEQGKSSEEIMDQLREFSKYGIQVSNTYQQLLKSQEDTEDEFEEIFNSENSAGAFESFNPDSIDYQNKAVLLDEKNKETLRESLIDFYDYIENKKEKKNKAKSLIENISNIIKSVANTAKNGLELLGLAFLGGFKKGKGGVVGKLAIGLATAAIAGYALFGTEWGKIISEQTKDLYYTVVRWFKGLFGLGAGEAPINGTMEENAAYLMKKLTDEGYSEEFAAGVVGNLEKESSFNPEAKGDKDAFGNYTSFGIAQWHNERFTDLKEFAGSRDYKDLGVQADFLVHELKQNGMTPGKANSLSVAEASEWMTRNYEIPANMEYEVLDRQSRSQKYASLDYEKILEDLEERNPEYINEDGIGSEQYAYNKILEIQNNSYKNTGDTSANGNLGSGFELTLPKSTGSTMALTDNVNPNFQVNDQIILDEETKNKEEKARATAKRLEDQHIDSGPDPIEIPSHLGGGGILPLNIAMR